MTLDMEITVARLEAIVPMNEIVIKRMFGGKTFMWKDHMLMCVSKKGLMLRVGAQAEAEVLKSPHAAPCMGTGRPMTGFVMISPEALQTEAELKHWVAIAQNYVGTLPPKTITKKIRMSQ